MALLTYIKNDSIEISVDIEIQYDPRKGVRKTMKKKTDIISNPKRRYFSVSEFLAANGIELNHRLGMAFGNLASTIAHFTNTYACKIRTKKDHLQNPPEYLNNSNFIWAKGYNLDTLEKTFIVWKTFTKVFKNLEEWTIAPITLQGINTDSQGMHIYYRPEGYHSLDITKYRLGFFFDHMKMMEKNGRKFVKPSKTRVIPGKIRKQLEELLGEEATKDEIAKLSRVIETLATEVNMEVVLEEPTVKIISKWKAKCRECNGVIAEGEEINWKRGYGVWHVTCPVTSHIHADEHLAAMAVGS